MKILMVCLGNICRSPLAEGILRSKISEKYTVASAGTISFHEGSPPDKRSTKTAQEHGVDISHQRANYFTEKHLEDFDKIICMVYKRWMWSLRCEWAVHNVLYKLGLWRSHTKDVDLNYPIKWYVEVLYVIFGTLIHPFA